MTTNATDTGRLWVGLLAGPVAWAAQLLSVYTLAAPACGTWPVAPLHVVSAVCLAAAAGGGWLAWQNWRAVGGWPSGGDETAVGRTRLMAVVGMMTGTLFSVVILAQWIAVMALPPCPQ